MHYIHHIDNVYFIKINEKLHVFNTYLLTLHEN